MLNIEHPHLQACYEDVVALQAARDADVVERLLNPERESFVRELHLIRDEVCFYERTTDRKGTIERTGGKQPTDVVRTIVRIEEVQNWIADEMVDPILGDEDRSHRQQLIALGVIDDMLTRGLETHGAKLDIITCLGLIASQHKPPESRVTAVLQKPKKRKEEDLDIFKSTDDTVFQEAVNGLRHIHDQALRMGEEEAIAPKLGKFRQQIMDATSQEDPRIDRAIDILNRYDYGRLARRTLELVMRPSTTRRDTLDEIAVTLGDVRPPKVPELTPGYTGPVVNLPWPILPPPERKRDTEKERPVATRPVRAREPREIIRDALRTEWLGMLATRWPYASEITPVDLHSIGEEINEYEAAFLYGPDNITLFAGVAESSIAFPHNSLHVAVASNLRDEQGRPLSVTHVLRGAKRRAVQHGSKQFNHSGRDVYKRAVDYLRFAFQMQYGEPLILHDAE